MIVELTPLLDQHPGFPKIPKPFPVQAFIPQLSVEALNESVLPGSAFLLRSQRMTAPAVNSVPWSERMQAGFL